MDYEKAYREALDRAKAGKSMNEVFPELKESEDERIRKHIIGILNSLPIYYWHDQKKKDDALAYLEKQKPVQLFLHDTFGYEEGRQTGQNEGVKLVLNNPEKYGLQKEQKPAQFKGKSLAEIIKGEFEGFRSLLKKKGIDYEPQSTYWESFARLFDSSAREYLKEQQPADDKAFEEWIDDWWKHNKVNNPDSYDKGDEIQFDEQGFKNFCRGIRNMYQHKPAEWGEEDEYVINKVLNWAEIVNPTSTIFEKLPKEQFIERLKSLRLQPHWKPSQEQINALKVVARGFPADDPGAIDSLLADLQKLL